MNSPFAAVLAAVAVVAAGASGFFAADYYGGPGLTDAERAEIDTLVAAKFDAAAADTITAAVASYLAANPGVVGEASIDQTRFGARVREFLITNPEVINEAIAELEKQRAEQEVVARAKALDENHETLFNSTRQVVIGNPEGNVTLVEFFDYNCTYCRRAQGDMEKLLAADPNLRVVLKEFPVLGPASIEAARVGIAVKLAAPERYKEFHDHLLTADGPVNKDTALAAAAELGIDRAAVEAALDDPEVAATIDETYQLANALSLTGTPSYVVGKEVVVGAVGYDQLTEQIALARAASTPVPAQ